MYYAAAQIYSNNTDFRILFLHIFSKQIGLQNQMKYVY